MKDHVQLVVQLYDVHDSHCLYLHNTKMAKTKASDVGKIVTHYIMDVSIQGIFLPNVNSIKMKS